ncbi:MAG: hypothetical protein R3Y43_01250 [Alphaproteobacteria bacterium]
MAKVIETKRLANGKALLLCKGKRIYIKGCFQGENFTSREIEVPLEQPSNDIRIELLRDLNHSKEALDFIKKSWQVAEQQDKRFKL